MSRLEELIKELCPNGVEYVRIKDLTYYEQPTKYIVNNTDYSNEYDTPVLTAGQTFILGYTNETEGIYEASCEKPVILFDDFTGSFKWVDFPFKVKSSAMKLITVNNKVVFRYLFHVMSNIGFSSDEHKRLWIGTYSEIEIPVPPLEVQREIVRILDSFTLLTAELTAELTARKKQYEFYRDELLNFDSKIPLVTLGEVATVTKLAGFEFTNYVKYSDEGKIIAVRGLNVKSGKLDLTDVKYIDNSDLSKLSRSKLHIGDMLFTYVGTIGQVAIIDEEDKYYLAPNVALIRSNSDKLIPDYMRLYFQSGHFWHNQINRLIQSSSMKNIPMEKIRQFQFPLPPVEVQKRLIYALDNFDSICSDLNIGLPAEIEARQKQYEYYRDALLTFAETGTMFATHTHTHVELVRLIQYVFGCVMVELSDVAAYSDKRVPAEAVDENSYVGVDNLLQNRAGKKKAQFVPQNGNLTGFQEGDILIGNIRPYLKKIWCADCSGGTNGDVLAIHPLPIINSRFLYHVLASDEFFNYDMQNAKGAKMPRGDKEQVMKYKLCLPTLEEQARIVSILDRFDSLCNDISQGLPAEIEARQKQYEHYRDKLLTFEPLQ